MTTPPPQANDERIAALEQECEEKLRGWQRALADYQNLQKEYRELREKVEVDTKARLLRDWVSGYDAFLQAWTAAPEEEKQSAWGAGVQHFLSEQERVLRDRWGVTIIDAALVPFDPALHEAVTMEAENATTVVRVLQRGYRIGDRLITPARVVVGNVPAEPTP